MLKTLFQQKHYTTNFRSGFKKGVIRESGQLICNKPILKRNEVFLDGKTFFGEAMAVFEEELNDFYFLYAQSLSTDFSGISKCLRIMLKPSKMQAILKVPTALFGCNEMLASICSHLR